MTDPTAERRREETARFHERVASAYRDFDLDGEAEAAERAAERLREPTCDGCDDVPIAECSTYRVRFTDGAWETVRYCRECADLARANFNGETEEVRDTLNYSAEQVRIAALSIAFSAMLWSSLSPQEMGVVIHRNRQEKNGSVCHSHDFIDANEVMAEAWEIVFGEEPDVGDDIQAARWSAAWQLAKANRFSLRR